MPGRLDRATLGRRGEEEVAALLERRGFVILGRNVRAGRLELDVVARKERLVVVVEVRARTARSAAVVHPAETLDAAKLARVRRGAMQWIAAQSIRGVDVRVDAAAVVFDGDDPHIDYYENVLV